VRGARRAHRTLLASLAGAQVAYAYLPARRRRAATRAIVALMLATTAAEACAARGRRRGLALVAGPAGVGFAAELVGTATGRPFGRYRYGAGLGPRLRGVPVLAAAAWGMMARPAWVVAGLIDARPRRRVALAAGALTAWDAFLDPRMVRERYWTWARGGRYEDVPASNFVGWLITGLVAFSLCAAIDASDEPEIDGDGALALYAWTWVGETFANAAIWRRRRIAVAGGAAMGAFAAPALSRRLRGRPPRPR
jgi:uncharacterized membrane protein